MSTDLRSELERARRSAPSFNVDVDALLRTGERRARRRRLGTMALALAVGSVVIVGALSVARTRPGAVAGSGGGNLPVPAGLAIPAGDYLYRRAVTFSPAGDPISTTASWWASDGSGRLRLSTGEDTTFGPGEMVTDTGPLGYLSADASVLREQMIQRMAPDGASPEPADQFTPGPGQPDHTTAGLIRSIGELLADPNTTPDLRAALFRVAAGLDGVQVARDVLDPVGRPAIELSVSTEERLHHWWFDPQTQQLLAWKDDAPSGWLEVIEAEGFTTSSASTHVSADLVPAPVHDPTS